jgi:hypothetical protein
MQTRYIKYAAVMFGTILCPEQSKFIHAMFSGTLAQRSD